MSKNKKEQGIDCIVYLSSVGDLNKVEIRENKQLNYIREYAKAHNIKITKIIRRNALGQSVVNSHWEKMISSIKHGSAKGIFLANMASVSKDIPDAFYKVGKVIEAGGMVITVDEGKLSMPIKKMKDGRMVLSNENS